MIVCERFVNEFKPASHSLIRRTTFVPAFDKQRVIQFCGSLAGTVSVFAAKPCCRRHVQALLHYHRH